MLTMQRMNDEIKTLGAWQQLMLRTAGHSTLFSLMLGVPGTVTVLGHLVTAYFTRNR